MYCGSDLKYVTELMKLRDFMYQDRSDILQLDLGACPELKAFRIAKFDKIDDKVQYDDS